MCGLNSLHILKCSLYLVVFKARTPWLFYLVILHSRLSSSYKILVWEEHYRFEASMIYIASSRKTRATQKDFVSKTKRNKLIMYSKILLTGDHVLKNLSSNESNLEPILRSPNLEKLLISHIFINVTIFHHQKVIVIHDIYINPVICEHKHLCLYSIYYVTF